MKTVEVVAALILDGAKIFATAGGYGPFKGLWEFPGGKKRSRRDPAAGTAAVPWLPADLTLIAELAKKLPVQKTATP